MGQTLVKPITTKETASCANSQYRVGSSSMQGWRINMEDAHIHLLSLPDDNDAAFFAVYDGHGGAKISQYASVHLHKKILSDPAYAKGNIKEAIKNGFLNLDEQMREDDGMSEEMSGTTASTVLIKNSMIYCANLGDSRAVASVSGKAYPLSFDHKPCNDEEYKRIHAAGGFVELNRVNGNLALSRALGDFNFKKNNQKSAEEQVVTANPEITKTEITSELEFIVLACDGIWDVLSSQEVIDFCRDALMAGFEPEQICENLLDRCLSPDSELSGLGCDNMTVVLVILLQNHSPEEYHQLLISRGKYKPESVNEESNNNNKQALIINSNECVGEENFLTPNQSPKSELTSNNEVPFQEENKIEQINELKK